MYVVTKVASLTVVIHSYIKLIVPRYVILSNGVIFTHRVLGKVLTLNISTIGETPIFRCGIVIRIIPYAYFSPPLSLPFT